MAQRKSVAPVRNRSGARFDPTWGTYVQSPRQELLEHLSTPAAQREIGAQVSPDEAGAARAFLRSHPEYYVCAANFHRINTYLDSNVLPMTQENLELAWAVVRRNGGITTQDVEAMNRQQAGKIDFERMSDQQVNEQMQRITDQRMKRRREIEKLERQKF